MCEDFLKRPIKAIEDLGCFRITHLRVMLLVVLATAMDLAWLLEQPGSSLMEWHPRFRWVIRRLPKALCVHCVISIEQLLVEARVYV